MTVYAPAFFVFTFPETVTSENAIGFPRLSNPAEKLSFPFQVAPTLIVESLEEMVALAVILSLVVVEWATLLLSKTL